MGGSWELTFRLGDVVAQLGDVVAQMGDVVAQIWGIWWLRFGGCGGSDLGDVVAQMAKATGRHQTEDAAVPGSNPAPPQAHSHLNGARIFDCVSYKNKNLSK
jgi:hypothetical protein